MSKDLVAPRKSFVEEALAAREAEQSAAPEFLINRQSAVPLHVQIKEQIRYAIMSGDLAPGTALPSIRELTSQLRVHRNTVHRVYMELQATGLLTSRPGVGVFVNEALGQAVSPQDLSAAEALIERLFADANSLGINPVTLGGLIAQRAPAWDARNPTIAFVECTAHQSVECARDLGDAFGVHVAHWQLDALRASPCKVSPHIRHVITSVFHYDEVKAWAATCDRRVHAVTYGLHPETKRRLKAVKRDRRLGFVCQDANTEEVIGREVAAHAPSGVFVGCANVSDPDSALSLIDQVDTVILTEAAASFCIENCTPSHDLLELHFALHPPSVDKVRRILLYEV